MLKNHPKEICPKQNPFNSITSLRKISFSKKTAFAFNQLVLRYKLQKYLLRMECISLSNSIEKITKKNNFKKYYVSSNANRKSFLKLINSLHKII